MVEEGLINFPITTDEATRSLIYDWFRYREVNDNELFPNMFYRELSRAMRKYNQLLRIEPGQLVQFEDGVYRSVNYDWLIQNYREHMTTTTDIGTYEEEVSGSTGKTITNNYTDTVQSSLSGHDVTDRDTSGSGTTHDEGSSESNDKSLGKASPQSASYVNGANGFPTTLDWTYPGQQGESKGSGSNESDGRYSNSGSEDVDFTTSRTGTTTTSRGGTGGETGTNSGTKESSDRKDGLVQIVENGRNTDPATILRGAKDFILSSSAWDYLYGAIDKCFQGVILEW